MPEVDGPSPFPGRVDPEAFNLPELLTRLPVPRPGDDNVELTELHRRDQDDRRWPRRAAARPGTTGRGALGRQGPPLERRRSGSGALGDEAAPVGCPPVLRRGRGEAFQARGWSSSNWSVSIRKRMV